MIRKKEISKLKNLLVDEWPTDDVRELEKHIVEIYAECYFIPELQKDAIHCIRFSEVLKSPKIVCLIVYGVHNMIDHCHWTLQDLMGIRQYSTKIEIEYRKLN